LNPAIHLLRKTLLAMDARVKPAIERNSQTKGPGKTGAFGSSKSETAQRE